MSLIQPKHDPFFSLSLEKPAIAYAFFKQHAPAYVAENLDLENIGRIDRKHTATELNQREKDIIYKTTYKTTLGQTGTAFICIEHQSQEQWQMPLRLLQYHLDTTRMYLNAGNKKWPLVISLLFHQGPRSPYPYASQLTGYYEDPTLGDQQLFFRFYIVDITQMSDKEILTHGLCAPVELLLKHARDGKFELSVEEYRIERNFINVLKR